MTGQPTPVVRLRRGDRTLPRIFVLPDATGGVLSSVLLARTWRSRRPVVGLNAPTDDEGLPRHDRVEDIAAAAVAAIRTVQPHGPYALLGYSFGTMVAWESARVLLADGEQIEQVVLLDPYVGYRTLRPLARVWFLLARRPWQVIVWMARSDRAERLRFLLRVVSVVVPWRRRIPEINERRPDPAMVAHARASVTALAAYRPGPLAAPVTIVNCAQKFPAQCDPMPVLTPLLPPTTVQCVVPGSHADLVSEPVVGIAADLVDAAFGTPVQPEGQGPTSVADATPIAPRGGSVHRRSNR
jgi:acetoacetyl-CoA synthetase